MSISLIFENDNVDMLNISLFSDYQHNQQNDINKVGCIQTRVDILMNSTELDLYLSNHKYNVSLTRIENHELFNRIISIALIGSLWFIFIPFCFLDIEMYLAGMIHSECS